MPQMHKSKKLLSFPVKNNSFSIVMLQMGKKLRHTPQPLPFQLLPAVKEFPIDIHVFIKMPCEKPMLCHIAVSVLRERAPEISAADQEVELLCELLWTAVDQPRRPSARQAPPHRSLPPR